MGDVVCLDDGLHFLSNNKTLLDGKCSFINEADVFLNE